MKLELRHKRCALCLLGLVTGPMFVWLGWMGVRDEIWLRLEGLSATASVTDWRVMKDRYGRKSYEVQYEFIANGWAGRFFRRDPVPLGRDNLWSPVAEESWNKTRQTPAIEVLYLNADPWVNRPFDAAGATLGDPMAGLVLGAACILASTCTLAVAGCQYLRRDRLMIGQVFREFVLFRLTRGKPGEKHSEQRSALLERIGDINNAELPRPLVSLELFFEGNDDPGSIGCNLPNPVAPPAFYKLLKELRDRHDVHDVLIEVRQMEDPDAWPFSDTIWFLTSAEPAEVRSWFPEEIAPDDIVEGFTPDVETYNVPDGLRVIGAWYD